MWFPETNKSITLLYKLFGYWFPLPIEWNHKTQSFFTRRGESNSKRYIPWLVVIHLAQGCLFSLPSLYTLANASKYSLVSVIFAAILFPIATFDVVCGRLLYNHCEEVVLGLEQMQHLLRSIPDRNINNQKWKLIASQINFNLVLAAMSPFGVPAFMLMSGLDPLYNFLNDNVYPLFEDHRLSLLVLLGCRFIFATVIFIEGWRFWSTAMVLLFVWVERQSTYINWMLQIDNRNNVDEFFERFKKCFLATRTVEVPLAFLVRNILGVIFTTIVTCSAALVRYGHQLSPSIAWFVSSCDLAVLTTAYFILPFITEAYENSKAMFKDIEEKIGQMRTSSKRGITRTKVNRSLSPIVFRCGGSFILKRETKATFYMTIAQRTIDTLLMLK